MFARTMNPAPTFRVGDIVSFGRPNGEKTEGRVVKVNAASVSIEQTEVRGQTRLREAGAKWRVHPSLVSLVNNGGTAPVAAPKPTRSEAELIAALQRLEGALSPENLYCDGERPVAQARRLEARLLGERRTLIAELGREPTTRELWGC